MKNLLFSTILYVFLSVFLHSCDNKNLNNNLPLRIKINVKRVENKPMKSICTEVRYYPISTQTDTLIGWVHKIICFENGYVLYDDSKSNAVFFLDINCNILFVHKNIGEGPGETTAITDVYLSDNEIIIKSNNNHKRLYYTLKGKYLREIKSVDIESPKTYIQLDSNNYATIHGGLIQEDWNKATDFGKKAVMITDDFLPFMNVLILNKNHKGVKAFSRYYNNQHHMWPNNPFSKYKDEVLATFSMKDTIFKITKDSLNVKYIIDFGDNIIPMSLREKHNVDEINQILGEEDKYAGNVNTLLQNEEFIAFKYQGNKKWNGAIWSKKSGNYVLISELENDINGGPIAIPKAVAPDGSFVASISAADFKKKVYKDTTKVSKEVLDIARKITDLSNPILIKMKFKDF